MAWARTLVAGGAVALAAGGLYWALAPRPAPVDIATVTRGAMEVTVAAEGITIIENPWTVTAPLSGTTTRSPVEVGDSVTAGETVVATIRPAAPAFLDARARAQAQAAVSEAEAAVRLAEVNLTRAETDLAYADSQLERNRALSARGIIPVRALEDSEQQAATAAKALEAARYELELNRATLARMEAQLAGPTTGSAEPSEETCCMDITAPADGTVLSVADKGARLVQAGEPLVTIGDMAELGIETDLLSSDAVRIAVGARAHVERWGGPEVLDAVVTRIDPAGFARVSALGIEEQRVRVHLAIESPPEARRGLGDRYRVFVRIVVWSAEDVLQVPQSALFRMDGGWAVYRIEGDRLRLTPVETGQRQDQSVEVLAGLAEGDRVVAYPGAGLGDGDQVTERLAE